MRFSLTIVLALASVAYSLPKEEAQLDAATSLAQSAANACGAAGSCHGPGGGELCNDRCEHCTDSHGKPYTRGECCGV